MSEYELETLKEIRKWKMARSGLISLGMRVVNWPAAKLTDLAFKLPGVDKALEVSVGEMMNFLNDTAQWSVRTDAIIEEYRDKGHQVMSREDIFTLDLEHVDRVIGRIDLKYQGLAMTGGVAAGTIGLVGIPADVATVAALNLRAAGEYATYCGFDIAQDIERLYALNLLNVAAMDSTKTKRKAIEDLEKIAREISAEKAGGKFEKQSFVRIVKAVSQGLFRMLTRQKASQSIPLFGALIGGGSNFFFTDDVCEAAQNLYRERFLIAKYGELVI